MRWLLAIVIVLFFLFVTELAVADSEDIDISMIQHGPRLTEIVVHFEDNSERSTMIENKDLSSSKTFDKVQDLIKDYEDSKKNAL